jgi:hypothetical protein
MSNTEKKTPRNDVKDLIVRQTIRIQNLEDVDDNHLE